MKVDFFKEITINVEYFCCNMVSQVAWPYARTLTAYTIPFLLTLASLGVRSFAKGLTDLEEGMSKSWLGYI